MKKLLFTLALLVSFCLFSQTDAEVELYNNGIDKIEAEDVP